MLEKKKSCDVEFDVNESSNSSLSADTFQDNICKVNKGQVLMTHQLLSSIGISEPRVSVTGAELPTARYVSAVAHRDLGYHDHAVTVYLPAWGQLIDHDMTQGGESKGKGTN